MVFFLKNHPSQVWRDLGPEFGLRMSIESSSFRAARRRS